MPGRVIGLAQKHQVNALVHCLHKGFRYGKIIGLMQGFPLYFAANVFQCSGILGKGGGGQQGAADGGIDWSKLTDADLRKLASMDGGDDDEEE